LINAKNALQQRDHNRRSIQLITAAIKPNDKGIWSFMGVLGEVALLRYFNLLTLTGNTLSTDKGFCGVDVGDIWEVRAMSKFGNRLFLWSDEVTQTATNSLTHGAKLSLILTTGNVQHVCGWSMGYEIAMNGVHAISTTANAVHTFWTIKTSPSHLPFR
jgi:hypothetical protein